MVTVIVVGAALVVVSVAAIYFAPLIRKDLTHERENLQQSAEKELSNIKNKL